MEIDPKTTDPKDLYKLAIGCVVPRPIAFVSTASPAGIPNLAPFSYFTVASHDPLSLVVCIAGPKPDGSMKDTLRNARPAADGGTGEFVVNVAVEGYAAALTDASAALPYERSEFDRVGLTPAPSRRVRPPRVAESPVAFECRTSHIIPIGRSTLLIGEVVHIFGRDGVVDAHFHVDPDALAAIGRMAGNAYARTRDRFDIPRPPDA